VGEGVKLRICSPDFMSTTARICSFVGVSVFFGGFGFRTALISSQRRLI